MSDKIHPTAVIASSAQIGSNVAVGPYTVVDEGAVIGDNTMLDAHVVIGKETKMGDNNRVFAGAQLPGPRHRTGHDWLVHR